MPEGPRAIALNILGEGVGILNSRQRLCFISVPRP